MLFVLSVANLPDTPHTAALRDVLQQYWGYDDFRPLQREAMTAVMDSRDSVVVLPTGGGKSLCFQAPAVAMDGMAVVVSPLIALMKDQVDTLRNCGVAAAYLNSTLSTDERREITKQVKAGELKLLYIAPERLLLDGTLTLLANANISLAAIDEAHCISSWGHDFRPEYRGLARLKEVFPNIGVHAYTATATPAVRNDIAAQLGLSDAEMLVGSFDRPNLTYRVRPASGKLQRIHEVTQRHRGESGVVYCISRKEVEKTAGALQELGVKAAPYHAGLADVRRQRTQDDFLNDRIEVIVATVAFGMGIDKPDVRFVVHAGMPKSLEAYQQEAGRAGRDGLPAECQLLFSRGDAMLWKRIIENPNDGDASPDSIEASLKALDGVSSYASGVTCRHRALVEHFGQSLDGENCEACDVCLNELDLVDDPLLLARKIVSCVARLEQRYGADYTCKVLAGSSEERILSAGHDRLSTYGLLKEERSSDLRDWVEQLVGQGFLVKAGEYGVLHLTPAGMALLKGEGTPRLLRAAKKSSSSRSSSGASKRDTESWEGVDRDLFEALRQRRSQIAGEAGVPAYVVFGDASLRDMARRRPSTMDAFGHTHGVGQKKLREYGETFLEEITSYCAENGVAVDVETEAGPVTKKPAATRSSTPNASSLAAFPLFREGTSIDDAAAQLGRARSTTVGYLSDFLKQETVTDPTPWVERALASQIEGAIEEVGLSGLKPIHEQLGGEIDYDSIRIVATCVANREVE